MEEKNYIDIWSVVARQLFNLSDNWLVYSLEFLDEHDGYLEPMVKIGAAVIEGTYSKGPRKGQVKYSKTQRRILNCTTAIFDKMYKEYFISKATAKIEKCLEKDSAQSQPDNQQIVTPEWIDNLPNRLAETTQQAKERRIRLGEQRVKALEALNKKLNSYNVSKKE